MRKIYAIILLILVGTLKGYAQEEPYRIDKLTLTAYQMDGTKKEGHNDKAGRITPDAFARYFGQIEGKQFANKAELDAYVHKLDQDMIKSGMFHTQTVVAVPGAVSDGAVSVELQVEAIDTWPAFVLPGLSYNSSRGFSAMAYVLIPNIAGEAFDMYIKGKYTAPVRDDGTGTGNKNLAWLDPDYKILFGFGNIAVVENVILNAGVGYVYDSLAVFDRGEQNLVYHKSSFLGAADVAWRFDPLWTLRSAILYEYAIDATIDPEYQVNSARYDVIYQNSFHHMVSVTYDDRELINYAYQGWQASTEVFYDVNQSYFSHRTTGDFGFKLQGSYEWIVGGFFYPRIGLTTFFKTGDTIYDMGSYVRGIFDGEWKGNGVTALNIDLLFKLFAVPHWFEFQIGPFVDYGISYGIHQNFQRHDQGATIGITTKTVLYPLSSVSIIVGMGYDLRNKYDYSSFNHFEFNIDGALNF